MSVYIKGMRMPESCDKCMMRDGLYCMANDYKRISYGAMHRREEWCPLVDLGKHGRLIDFDALIEKYWDGNSMVITEWDLKDIKAVIEAEDSE